MSRMCRTMNASSRKPPMRIERDASVETCGFRSR
jgi:hypothetical protein